MLKYIENTDIVLGKFISYMNKALLHKKLDYINTKNRIANRECSIENAKDYLKYEDNFKFDLQEILTDKEIKVLELHLVEKNTYLEISKILNLKPESIRKIQYRAIKKIKDWRENNDKNRFL